MIDLQALPSTPTSLAPPICYLEQIPAYGAGTQCPHLAGAARGLMLGGRPMPLGKPLLLLVYLLSVSAAARCGDPKEQDKLEGVWTFVQSDADQKKGKRPRVRMVLKGNTIAFETEGKKGAVRGTYTVDPSKSPKTMDINLVGAKDGAKATIQAIYELDGDTLKLCHYLGAVVAKERPKAFVADKQTVLGILKRDKK
jgi:uncharacterized protein (TIGR03067 family)